MLKKADPTQYRPDASADYPKGDFARAMTQVAQLIKADVGLEAAFVDIDGWDTHVNHGGAGGQLAGRLHAEGRRVLIALAPKPYKDANELLVKQGANAVEKAIETAKVYMHKAAPEWWKEEAVSGTDLEIRIRTRATRNSQSIRLSSQQQAEPSNEIP